MSQKLVFGGHIGNNSALMAVTEHMEELCKLWACFINGHYNIHVYAYAAKKSTMTQPI